MAIKKLHDYYPVIPKKNTYQPSPVLTKSIGPHRAVSPLTDNQLRAYAKKIYLIEDAIQKIKFERMVIFREMKACGYDTAILKDILLNPTIENDARISNLERVYRAALKGLL